MKTTLMPNTILYSLLLLAFIFTSCDSPKPENKLEKESEEVEYNLEKFNDLSTFFILDSITSNNRLISIHFSDTSKFYQPERHVQFYTLVFLTTLDKSILETDIDSVTFDVSMWYREDGDIIRTFSSKELLPILHRFTIPSVKDKIIALNEYNKKDYISRVGDKDLDVLYKLNMYFTQIVDPGSWFGTDSYGIIWEYEYNKAGGYDMTGHIDAFNKILTDTMYMEEREVGKEVYRILMK